MYQAEIRISQQKDCILSELAEDYGDAFHIAIEELHDNKVTFVLTADRIDVFCERLEAAPEVEHCEQLDDSNVLVTKESCGAYSAFSANHGILRREGEITRNDRIYNVLFYQIDDLKGIVDNFRSIGSVSLEKLEEFESSPRDSLTERQYEVVELALDRGYFQWPRDTPSEELAAELDISRATFLEHLRKAEAELLSKALEAYRGVEQPPEQRPNAR